MVGVLVEKETTVGFSFSRFHVSVGAISFLFLLKLNKLLSSSSFNSTQTAVIAAGNVKHIISCVPEDFSTYATTCGTTVVKALME